MDRIQVLHNPSIPPSILHCTSMKNEGALMHSCLEIGPIQGIIIVFQPPVTTNYMVRPGQPPKLVEVISELGIFGYVIGLAKILYKKTLTRLQSFKN